MFFTSSKNDKKVCSRQPLRYRERRKVSGMEEEKNKLWVSPALFSALTLLKRETVADLMRRGFLPVERVPGKRGKCRIHVTDFFVPGQEEYFQRAGNQSFRDSNLLEFQNNRVYNTLNPSQRKDVDRWVPILLRARDLSCRELENFCKISGLAYGTVLHHRILWRKSNGNILSLARNYHNAFSFGNHSPFLSVYETATTLKVSKECVRYLCQRGKMKGAFKDFVAHKYVKIVWFIPRASVEEALKRMNDTVSARRLDRPRSSASVSIL